MGLESTAGGTVPGTTRRPVARRPRALTIKDGNSISLTDLEQHARRRRLPSRRIALAGPSASGKTTLLVSIYESFQHGPFGDYNFAGSDTLIAFEERCHEGRLIAETDVADTARTLLGQAGSLLHLALTPTSVLEIRDLYVGDVSGEHYEQIIAKPGSARELGLLELADRIAIIAASDRLVEAATRDRELYRIQTLARAIVEHAQLKTSAVVDVVATKLDLALTDEKRKRIESASSDIARVVGSRVGRISLTCARSTVPAEISSGHGLDELLQTWVGNRTERPLRNEDDGAGADADA